MTCHRFPAYLLLAVATILPGKAFPRVVNIPEDYETIQEGINQAESTDTVLISPGFYRENLLLQGKPLTIAGMYLLSGDTADISATIIDGDESGTVLAVSADCDGTVLTGFTVQNGRADSGGGIRFSSVTSLLRLIVRNNHASGNGGGISSSRVFFNGSYLTVTGNTAGNGGAGISHSTRGMRLSNSVIANNRSEGYAGGIYISPSWFDTTSLYNVAIVDNYAESSGGGLDVRSAVIDGVILLFTNVTIANNTAEFEGNGICFHSRRVQSVIQNSIFWGNNVSDFTVDPFRNQHSFIISYSDIEQLEAMLDDTTWSSWTTFEDGIISEDPEFLFPQEGNYSLRDNSPCRDTGNPLSPDDPDGSRADMGVRGLYYVGRADASGSIFRARDGEAIQGAEIRTSLGQSTLSDRNGHWEIEDLIAGSFTMKFSAEGFADSTSDTLQIDPDGELVLDIGLHFAEISVTDYIEHDIESGGVDTVELIIENLGDYPLQWQSQKLPNPRLSVDPWTAMGLYSLERNLGMTRFAGIACVDDSFFVQSGLDENHREARMYVFDRDGVLWREFPLPNPLANITSDPEWDGDLLWCGKTAGLVGFDRQGDSADYIRSPFVNNDFLAWDNDQNLFWIYTIRGVQIPDHIGAVDREGNLVRIFDLESPITGLFYFPYDSDGYNLYCLMANGDNHRYRFNKVVKFNTTTGERQDVYEFPERFGYLRNTAFTADFDPFNHTLGLIGYDYDLGENSIHLILFSMGGNTNWMRLEPSSGVVPPESEISANLVMDAREIDQEMIHEGEIRLTHNSRGDSSSVIIRLNVIPNAINTGLPEVPLAFNLAAPFPNPFNSMTRINYTLPIAMNARLTIHDITGRVIENLHNGPTTAGSHSLNWNANQSASGIYIIQLEAGDLVIREKMILVK